MAVSEMGIPPSVPGTVAPQQNGPTGSRATGAQTPEPTPSPVPQPAPTPEASPLQTGMSNRSFFEPARRSAGPAL